jgi:predicted XRE-type DNA-binding protein
MKIDNVFSELGFGDDEATAEAWRSDMARVIRDYFKRSQQSQIAFANQLGVKQSVVSRVVNERLRGLSIEFLLRLCVKLGTRGIATWGPLPSEAYVTTEIPNVLGTALSVETATLNVAAEAVQVAAPAPAATRSRRGRPAGSGTALLKLN